MLNLRNVRGSRVQVRVGANVTSGTLAYVTGMLGLPVDHCLNGATVTFIQEGIVALTFSGQGTIGAGSYLYWDKANALLSLGANVRDQMVGQVLGSDPDGGSGVYLVRLQLSGPVAAATPGQPL